MPYIATYDDPSEPLKQIVVLDVDSSEQASIRINEEICDKDASNVQLTPVSDEYVNFIDAKFGVDKWL